MDALLSGRDAEDKKKKKSKKDKNTTSPHIDLTPFPLPDSHSTPWSASSSAFSPLSTLNGRSEMASPAPSGFTAPKAPWLLREASNDGTSSILSEGSSLTLGPSSINTARGRPDPRDADYDTDASASGRSKSRGKLRKRSKSRTRKGAGEGYETDDGYMSSTPASEKTLHKSKSRSRFFKLGNRSKSHVTSDDEHEAPPPVPVVPQPQTQFRLPIAARFATTLGDLNKGATVEPPLGDYPGLPGAKKQGPMVTATGNRSLEISKTDSVDFSTAMSKAFASQEESPTKQRSEPMVHFRTPIPPINTAPSSYQPNIFSGAPTRDSAGSGTSSEQHTSSSSSAAHSSTSHATTSTTATSIASHSPPSTATSSGSGLFSRFGSRRMASGDKTAKEVEKENQKTQISYPITRTSSPPPSPPTSHLQSSAASSKHTPPSSFTPTSSAPASGRTTPTERKVQRPLFLHRTPSSDRVAGKSEGPGKERPFNSRVTPAGGEFGNRSSTENESSTQKVRPTPSNLLIPPNVNNFSRSTSPVPSIGVGHSAVSSPSPIPSTTYVVPSPSDPVFSRPSPRLRTQASEDNFHYRTRISEENLRARTRVSEDTFAPPPSVFTIPPATPPPTSPLPDVPPSQMQASNGVFATQQHNTAVKSHYTPHSHPRHVPPTAPVTHLRAPSPSPGLRPSSPNSPMRGRESPFPAKPVVSPTPVSPPKAGLDGFGGRVKVRRYAELYGFQGRNGGEDEDDTISTAGGKVPVRRDNEEEWAATRSRQREDRERERRGGGGTNFLPASSHANRQKYLRPRQSTQVGIQVEEPSDPEDNDYDYREDEGYGGEEAFGGGSVDSHSGYVDDEDDAAYYGGRIGFSEEEREHSTSPALGRKRSYEALEKRYKDPKNTLATTSYRSRRSEEGYSESETGHSSQSHSTRSKSKSEESHYYGASRRFQPAPSPAASEDSHYSANGRFTMYEDDDYNPRSTMYSEAGSFVDENKSRRIRDRFVQRVEGMYDSNGRDIIPPVPALPSSTYLSASGRSSPNPPHEGSSRSQNHNARLAGIATGRTGGGSSPIPPVPKLPKGATVGIVGEDGTLVSSKLWI
ncbi:hypothetical protein E1B28_012175 [Marasmius oreades]|uniref:Uncharacterized protein n=1 Tax=Marasmius oreades TaxID=181124 RepID=A0A9P7RR12_9AGAR|nr:uncharacterized protein E1B28_012175 [Marasmius oreades]KAG7088154.1 hypothetical protein E1B28_012175 [Marasmius oreades]